MGHMRRRTGPKPICINVHEQRSQQLDDVAGCGCITVSHWQHQIAQRVQQQGVLLVVVVLLLLVLDLEMFFPWR
jgi:hypothetical protein